MKPLSLAREVKRKTRHRLLCGHFLLNRHWRQRQGQPLPKKILFVHIIKTAGTYVFDYLAEHLRYGGYRVIDVESSKDHRNQINHYLAQEAMKDRPDRFIHCHADYLPKEFFEKFLERGWFSFSFVRHPGDLLCSYYFYARINPDFHAEGSLDEFIRGCLMGRSGSGTTRLDYFGIPAYWKKMDFVAEFSETNFKFFLKKYFGHRYAPKVPMNVSENKGYAYYCDQGQISATTRAMLEASEQYRWYLEIKNKGVS